MSQEASLQALVLAQQRSLEEIEQLRKEIRGLRGFYEMHQYSFEYRAKSKLIRLYCPTTCDYWHWRSRDFDFCFNVCAPRLLTETTDWSKIKFGEIEILLCQSGRTLLSGPRPGDEPLNTHISDADRIMAEFAKVVKRVMRDATVDTEIRRANSVHLDDLCHLVHAQVERLCR